MVQCLLFDARHLLRLGVLLDQFLALGNGVAVDPLLLQLIKNRVVDLPIGLQGLQLSIQPVCPRRRVGGHFPRSA